MAGGGTAKIEAARAKQKNDKASFLKRSIY